MSVSHNPLWKVSRSRRVALRAIAEDLYSWKQDLASGTYRRPRSPYEYLGFENMSRNREIYDEMKRRAEIWIQRLPNFDDLLIQQERFYLRLRNEAAYETMLLREQIEKMDKECDCGRAARELAASRL